MATSLISFILLCALSVFFTWLPGVKSAAAPLLAVCAAVVFFTVAGVLGVLLPALWVFCALCAGLCALALARGGKALLARLASPGFILFFVLGLVLLVYLGLRQPLLREFDEFVHWGPYAKLIKLTGGMYPAAEAGWFWTATQSPALPVFGWFMQAFGQGFEAWKLYWACDVLLVACVSALLAPFGLRRWRVAVPLAVLGLLLPFVFSVTCSTTFLIPPYLGSYADIPAGMLGGAALVLYFGRRAAGSSGVWQAALPLAAMALAKDNTLAIALVAAGVMAADTLFLGAGSLRKAQQNGKMKAGRAWLLRAAGALACFAAVLLPYMLWARYTAGVVAQKTAAGQVGETHVSQLDGVAQAAGQLLGLQPRTERFSQVLDNLVSGFFGWRFSDGQLVSTETSISMMGSAFMALLCIVALFVLAMVFTTEKRDRQRVALAGSLLLLGYFAYHFVLLVFYAFLYHADGSAEAIDYGRYLSTYNLLFSMAGLHFLALAAKQRLPLWDAPRHNARARGAGVALLAVCCALLLRFAVQVRPGYSVLDYGDSLYAGQRQDKAWAEAAMEQVPPGQRVFFVCQQGTGLEWFTWHYHLLPTVVLDYSLTGGASLHPPAGDGGEGYTPEQLRDYLDEAGCSYMVVYQLDETFVAGYGALFADGLQGFTGTPVLYQKGQDGLYEFVMTI